jgi:catechol 2,3-dioxygenase-like lactoylglutathione lyase family enzyme
MKINLIVLKTNQLHALAQFYEGLGLRFEYHKHEQNIFHYSTVLDGTVFEIYPLPKKILVPDTTTRIGFQVHDLEILLEDLKHKGVKIIRLPSATSAIIEDLDGRKIELTSY